MPDRPADQPDVHPALVAGDPLLARIAAMLACLDLHLGRYEWRQLTTAQKELFADLVDSNHVLDAADPESGPWFVPRWWREDYVTPDFEDLTHREPDPFADRTSPPETCPRPDRAALRLAEVVTLGSRSIARLEERIAVYEWARRQVAVFRNADGDIVPGLSVYPSANQARAYLAEYRRSHDIPDPTGP